MRHVSLLIDVIAYEIKSVLFSPPEGRAPRPWPTLPHGCGRRPEPRGGPCPQRSTGRPLPARTLLSDSSSPHVLPGQALTMGKVRIPGHFPQKDVGVGEATSIATPVGPRPGATITYFSISSNRTPRPERKLRLAASMRWRNLGSCSSL